MPYRPFLSARKGEIDMSFEQMKTISIILYSGSALMFLLAVFFFFTFRIPQVISFLSGSQERKEVAALRKKGIASAENAHGTFPKTQRKRKSGLKGPTGEVEDMASRQAATEKIRTEELPESIRSKVSPSTVSPSEAQTAPPVSSAAPYTVQPTEIPPMDFTSPPTEVLSMEQVSPPISSSQVAEGHTQPLSPMPTAEKESTGFEVEIYPEFELFFYASSIPID